jgi:DNA-binding NarL/FixJ family response regulator
MSENAWRVVLLEDDAETRRYFEGCIEAHPQLTLAASFETLAEARAWFGAHTADVLLTDLALPDGHGLTLMRELARHQPACEVLVVSVFGDEDSVLACVEAGAVGYIHKDSRPHDVAQVIIDVKHGASPISPMIARKLLERLRARTPPASRTEHGIVLSPRESEVLELISRGYAYAEIARLQGVTMHTVQTHIKNLYAKLAVHSRSEAVFEASRMGLLSSMRPGK